MITETERLFLREMTAGDFDSLYKVLADSDSMKYYPYSFGKKEVENWINKNLERYRGADKRSSTQAREQRNSDHPF